MNKFKASEKVYSVGYLRVSDPSQVHGTSQENQDIILRKKSIDLGAELWPENEVFSEVFTGSSTHRPVYDELFKKVKTARKAGINIKYFIIHVIDRFTRDGAVSYATMKAELHEVGVELVDAYGMIQPMQNSMHHLDLEFSWSKFSPSEMGELMMAVAAKIEKRNILSRMISGEVLVARKGYRVRPPLDGFINKKVTYDPIQGKRATIQVPDPGRAHFYKSLFANFDNHALTQQEAVDMVNKMGFLTKKKRRWNKGKTQIIGYYGEKSLTLKQARKAVAHPGYAGISIEQWTGAKPMKAPYPGLVSIELFNRVNERINGGRVYIHERYDGSIEVIDNSQKAKVKRLKNNPSYPYRHVVLCPFCNPPRPMKGSAPRGKSGKRYPTLHCANGHKYFGISRNNFLAAIESFANRLTLSNDFIDALEVVLLRTFNQRESDLEEYNSSVKKQIETLEAKLENMLISFEVATTDTMRKRIENKAVELEKEIKKLQNEDQTMGLTKVQIHEFLLLMRKIVEHPEHSGKVLINTQDLEKQKAYFKLAFEELPTIKEILNGTPKLTELLKLRKAFEHTQDEESLCVSPEGLGWNTLKREINNWINSI